MGEFAGGGGRLSFRDADVVRGNEEYEKGYEGGGEGVIIGTGKGGGGVTQRFSCQQHYGPSTKKAVRERD